VVRPRSFDTCWRVIDSPLVLSLSKGEKRFPLWFDQLTMSGRIGLGTSGTLYLGPRCRVGAVPKEGSFAMRFQQFGERYIVRLQSGEPVIETLTAFLKEQDIEFATLSAAGAVQWVRLGYWNADTRAYEYREWEEQMEVVSFEGNSALKDGDPFLHLHGVFGRRDFTVIGGHIKEAHVHPTLEVWLRTERIPVRRTPDEASGLDLLDLPDQA